MFPMSPVGRTPQWIADYCSELRSCGLEFYAVATSQSLATFDMLPLGVKLNPVPIFAPNPAEWDATCFLKLFHSMDTHLFAGRGLTMPNWVLMDHVVLSSGLVVIAADPHRLEELGERFELTEDERFVLASLRSEAEDMGFSGPIPVASYCASPTSDPAMRVGWSLCSVIPRSGLGFVVKGLALAAYRSQFLSGSTQYDNIALRIHTGFGPARLRAALTEIHTAPHTLVYESDLRAWFKSTPLKDAYPEDHPQPTWLVSATDTKRHIEMQEMIDSRTHTLTILPPGITICGSERVVPILASDFVDHENRLHESN